MTAESTCKIVIGGRLSDRFADAFEGMALQAEEHTTVLVGSIADQSHLFGVLERIRSLGLDLLHVEMVAQR